MQNTDTKKGRGEKEDMKNIREKSKIIRGKQDKIRRPGGKIREKS